MRLLAAALVCGASAGAAASEAFCAAAIDGDVEAMKKSLTNGVDVDYLCPTAKAETAGSLLTLARRVLCRPQPTIVGVNLCVYNA